MRWFNKNYTSAVRLDGKTAVITGSGTGIGKVTAQDFFKRGARVILACRSFNEADQAVEEIKTNCKEEYNLGQLSTAELDLACLNSVRNCAESLLKQEKTIHLLINNAGIMMCPQNRTCDGYEIQFGTNHLGHFLLTLLLLPKICQSKPARIVNVSSLAYIFGSLDLDDLNWEKRRYSSLAAYQQSKLCNVLFTKELARRLREAHVEGVNVYSLHPGIVNTGLYDHLSNTYVAGATWAWNKLFGWISKTPEEGAQTTVYCAIDETCAKESGQFYSDCSVKSLARNARNEKYARTLWEESVRMVSMDNFNPFQKH